CGSRPWNRLFATSGSSRSSSSCYRATARPRGCSATTPFAITLRRRCAPTYTATASRPGASCARTARGGRACPPGSICRPSCSTRTAIPRAWPASRPGGPTGPRGCVDRSGMMHGSMGRRPEDQDAQVLLDVVEAMLDVGGDEDQAAGLDGAVLVRDADEAPPADDVVDLVLPVRLLAVHRPRRPYGQTDAQLLRREEIDVAVALLVSWLQVQLGNLVRLHRVWRLPAQDPLPVHALVAGDLPGVEPPARCVKSRKAVQAWHGQEADQQHDAGDRNTPEHEHHGQHPEPGPAVVAPTPHHFFFLLASANPAISMFDVSSFWRAWQ